MALLDRAIHEISRLNQPLGVRMGCSETYEKAN